MMPVCKSARNRYPKLYVWARRLHGLGKMAGRLLRRGTYWGRMYCVDDGRKVIYVAICKAASTSFRSAFLGITWTDAGDFKARVRASKGYLGNIDLDAYTDYYKFSFARNPFARLVSCYEEKYHAKRPRPFFETYLMGYLAKDRGFAEFARRVTRIPNFLADRHFCRQWDLLTDKKGRILCDALGHLENLTSEYEPIRARFDLAPLPRIRVSEYAKRDWREYYDEALAKRVCRHYKKDIYALGYGTTYESLLAHIRARPAH